MTNWVNDDGLIVRYGTDRTEPFKVGRVPAGDGSYGELVVDLSYTRLDDETAGTVIILDQIRGACIPEGSIIRSATIEVGENAWDSATDGFTLTVGLYKRDDTDSSGFSAIDADGIDAAVAEATLAAGASVTCDGALIDSATALAADGYIAVTAGSEVPTAGDARLVIHYQRYE